MIRKYALCLLIGLMGMGLYAQNVEDSLRSEIQSAADKESKVDLLNELAQTFFESNTDSVMQIGTRSYELAISIGYEEGAAYAKKHIGIAYYVQGEYVMAIQYWGEARDIFEKIGHNVGLSNMYNNMGAVYYDRGNDTKALDYYLQSLKYAELEGDTLRIATAWTNIGNVHSDHLATKSKAISAYLKALQLDQSIGYDRGIGASTLNLGGIYVSRDMLDSALYYLNISKKASHGSFDEPHVLNMLGNAHRELGEVDTAIAFHERALFIANKQDQDLARASSYLAIGKALVLQGKNDRAEEMFYKAIETTKKISDNSATLRSCYEGVAALLAEKGELAKAFEYQQLLLELRDSAYSVEVDQKLGQMLFDYEMEGKQKEIELLMKDQALKDADIENQKTIRNGLISAFALMALFAVVLFIQGRRISSEKDRSDKLLLNILPASVADELKRYGKAEAREFDETTILFTDFKSFTEIGAQLKPSELVEEVDACFKGFDAIIDALGLEKIKTIGDAYMAVGGLPKPSADSAHQTVCAALAMHDFIVQRKLERDALGLAAFEMRVGIHTGAVVAGIVGDKKFQYDIWGDAVNTAHRMETYGAEGKVNISAATYALVKEDPRFGFEARGKIEAKGKGEMEMWFVTQNASRAE